SRIGTYDDTSFSFRRSRYVSGCGTVTQQLSVSWTGNGAATYSETSSAPCFAGANRTFTGTMQRAETPDPLAISRYALPSLTINPMSAALGELDFNSVIPIVITLANSGDGAASNLSMSGLMAPFAFKGGTYPGTGGDCGNQLAPATSCSVIVEADASSI